MKSLIQAASALEPNRCSVILAPTCCHCAEFLASERTPCVGNCLLYAVPVLAQDKACSQYYPPEAGEPGSSDAEF